MAIVLRAAAPADALAVAELHVRSWQAAYRGRLPDAYLDGLHAQDRAAHYTFGGSDPRRPATVIAVDDETGAGIICGFATTGPARDADSLGLGELMALNVEPAWWRRGVGTLLIRDARARLGAHGFQEAVLWMMEGNQRAARFYDADGWLPDGERRTEIVWGVSVDEVRWRRAIV